MSRIEMLVDELCPNGVPFLPIEDPRVSQRVVSGATPKSNVPEYWEGGTIRWMSSGEVSKRTVLDTAVRITQEGFDSCSTKMIPAGAVVIALAGQGKTRGTAARTRVELCTNQSLASIITGHEMNSDFLYYYLRGAYQHLREISSGDGTRGGLNLRMIREYKVPLPPLPVQQEIVRELDKYTQLEAELEEELERELEARKAQFVFYRDKLLSFETSNATWMTIGDIGRVSMCKRVFKSQTADSGEIPFYKIGTFGKEPDAFIPQELFDEYRNRFSFPKRGDVLLSAAGTIGRAIIYDGAPAYFQDSNIVWIDNDETIVSNEYLRFWYQVIKWATDGGTIRRLYNNSIRRAKIAVPPLKEQQRIVSVLKNFEALTNDLSSGLSAEIAARRKQYEFYRAKLLTFKELPA